MNSRQHQKFLGVLIGSNHLENVTNLSIEAIDKSHPPLTFACANPHSLVEAQTDTEFRDILNKSDIVVADGVGVTLMARIAKIDVGPRITGEDYFFSIMKTLEDRGQGRVFFFGSSDKVLKLIRRRAEQEFPSITICGGLSPPYREWSDAENKEMINIINSSQPDVLWVGMTAPKQEKWASRNRDQLNVPVVGSIGAVFDFFAGTHPRAPNWICSMGLEWLYRLAREPRRMWRRNFISSPKFVVQVLWRHIFSFDKRSN